MSTENTGHNHDLARILNRIADALEIKGETGFRILAYRKAARVLEDLTEDVAELDRRGELDALPGIGSGIARKIREFLATGSVSKLGEVSADLPPGLFEILNVPGIGPRSVRLMHTRLGVKNLSDLQRVITDGTLARLPGMGAKKVANILRGLKAT